MLETPIEKLAKEKIDFIDYFNNHIAGCKPGVSKLGKATVCPFHDDTDPSFHSWEKIKGFRCFGCGATGDVIRAFQLYNKMYENRVFDRREAARALLDLYHIDYSSCEENPEENLSIFEMYRREYATMDFKFNKGVMTLEDFKRQNHEIIDLDDDIENKIKYYGKLDRRVGLIVSDSVENK